MIVEKVQAGGDFTHTTHQKNACFISKLYNVYTFLGIKLLLNGMFVFQHPSWTLRISGGCWSQALIRKKPSVAMYSRGTVNLLGV